MNIVDAAGAFPWSDEQRLELSALATFVEVPARPTSKAQLLEVLVDADYGIIAPVPGVFLGERILSKMQRVEWAVPCYRSPLLA